ncbi:hypothetical protein SAMN05216266_10710 [Amycolatopsis marina]|uniref:Uncharacterized protein n=1 Tax=Amycolatopsis marina TaxID=490629 RepID=A0A1I0ZHX1_9PSEU|nr:hypothetical protein [Amycolatopsis marina]SFB25254.1 hypothetical protein SAMN05216266_10710 [Amycolatopsis marina]
MSNVDRVTDLGVFVARSHEVQTQPDRVELVIDRFDHWGNTNNSAALSCYATYCRADELAA